MIWVRCHIAPYINLICVMCARRGARGAGMALLSPEWHPTSTDDPIIPVEAFDPEIRPFVVAARLMTRLRQQRRRRVGLLGGSASVLMVIAVALVGGVHGNYTGCLIGFEINCEFKSSFPFVDCDIEFRNVCQNCDDRDGCWCLPFGGGCTTCITGFNLSCIMGWPFGADGPFCLNSQCVGCICDGTDNYLPGANPQPVGVCAHDAPVPLGTCTCANYDTHPSHAPNSCCLEPWDCGPVCDSYEPTGLTDCQCAVFRGDQPLCCLFEWVCIAPCNNPQPAYTGCECGQYHPGDPACCMLWDCLGGPNGCNFDIADSVCTNTVPTPPGGGGTAGNSAPICTVAGCPCSTPGIYNNGGGGVVTIDQPYLTGVQCVGPVATAELDGGDFVIDVVPPPPGSGILTQFCLRADRGPPHNFEESVVEFCLGYDGAGVCNIDFRYKDQNGIARTELTGFLPTACDQTKKYRMEYVNSQSRWYLHQNGAVAAFSDQHRSACPNANIRMEWSGLTGYGITHLQLGPHTYNLDITLGSTSTGVMNPIPAGWAFAPLPAYPCGSGTFFTPMTGTVATGGGFTFTASGNTVWPGAPGGGILTTITSLPSLCDSNSRIDFDFDPTSIVGSASWGFTAKHSDPSPGCQAYTWSWHIGYTSPTACEMTVQSRGGATCTQPAAHSAPMSTADCSGSATYSIISGPTGRYEAERNGIPLLFTGPNPTNDPQKNPCPNTDMKISWTANGGSEFMVSNVKLYSGPTGTLVYTWPLQTDGASTPAGPALTFPPAAGSFGAGGGGGGGGGTGVCNAPGLHPLDDDCCFLPWDC